MYEELIATIFSVERRGATMPYTSVNGNMFSYLNSDGGLALRLPKDLREEFLARYETVLAASHGFAQKEYVAVPDDLLANTDELAPYFAASSDTRRPSSRRRLPAESPSLQPCAERWVPDAD